MLPEFEKFQKWMRRFALHSWTLIDYTSELTMFITWSGKLPGVITVSDVDEYIEYCQRQGHAGATINRRLAAPRRF